MITHHQPATTHEMKRGRMLISYCQTEEKKKPNKRHCCFCYLFFLLTDYSKSAIENVSHFTDGEVVLRDGVLECVIEVLLSVLVLKETVSPVEGNMAEAAVEGSIPSVDLHVTHEMLIP
jgi:hypothetical protein